jgi:hypothetical protein
MASAAATIISPIIPASTCRLQNQDGAICLDYARFFTTKDYYMLLGVYLPWLDADVNASFPLRLIS